MRSEKVFKFAAIVLVVCIAVMLWVGQTRPVERTKWQYATFLQVTGSVKLATFESPDSHIVADTGFDIYQKLGGKTAKAKFTIHELLDAIGEQGWELVLVDRLQDTAQFVFKRPTK